MFDSIVAKNGRDTVPVSATNPFPIQATLMTGVAMGAVIAVASASASAAIPNCLDGSAPIRVRLASTTACYVRVGVTSEESAAMNAAGTGYVVGDLITLAGGVGDPMILDVATTRLISAAVNAPGTGYVPADTVVLAGGAHATAAVATVSHTKVVSATVAAGGASGTDGTRTVTGTTGTGTKFQASVTVAGGAITAVLGITVAGDYTVGLTDNTVEPVTGASLVGAQLHVVTGAKTVSISTPGSYTVNSAALTQASTSGAGTGLTLDTGVFGVNTATVSDVGDYSENPANPVAQDTTTGIGVGATFNITWLTAAAAGNLLVQPGEAVIVDVEGHNEIAAIRVTADGILQIAPLEN